MTWRNVANGQKQLVYLKSWLDTWYVWWIFVFIFRDQRVVFLREFNLFRIPGASIASVDSTLAPDLST